MGTRRLGGGQSLVVRNVNPDGFAVSSNLYLGGFRVVDRTELPRHAPLPLLQHRLVGPHPLQSLQFSDAISVRSGWDNVECYRRPSAKQQ